MRKKRYERMEASYTTGGRYNTKKLPKWRFNSHDVVDYLKMLEDEMGNTVHVNFNT